MKDIEEVVWRIMPTRTSMTIQWHNIISYMGLPRYTYTHDTGTVAWFMAKTPTPFVCDTL